MKHPEVEAYLSEIGEALRFDKHYARDVCDEVADHLYESVASGEAATTPATGRVMGPDQPLRAGGSANSAAHEAVPGNDLGALFNRFGNPRVLAAQFASTYVFRKLLALLTWVFGVSAASYMLGLFVGPPSWIGLGLSCVCAIAVLPAILRGRWKSLPRTASYPQLCTPMMGSSAAVLLLGAALLASAAWKVEHCQPMVCTSYDIAVAAILLARLAVHRRQTARMCALWRSVS